jgi:hypothetical protein
MLPVPPNDMADLLPKASDDVCDVLVKAGQFDAAVTANLKWMFGNDGLAISDEFQTAICGVCATTTTTCSDCPECTTTTTTTSELGCDTLIPDMVSDSTPSGTVTASSGADPYKAFDQDDTSEWSAGTSDSTPWIQYQFTAANCVTQYEIYPHIETTGAGPYAHFVAPKTWSFQGSNDGDNWTALDNRNNVTGWADTVGKQFAFNNLNAYTYYRLLVTAFDTTGLTIGGSDTVQLSIAEISMCGPGTTTTTTTIEGSGTLATPLNLRYIGGTLFWDYVPFAEFFGITVFARDSNGLPVGTDYQITHNGNAITGNIHTLGALCHPNPTGPYIVSIAVVAGNSAGAVSAAAPLNIPCA